MTYLEKNALAPNEKVVLFVKKNALSVIFGWIGGILFCWLLFIPLIRAIKKTVKFCTTEFLISDKHVYEKYGLLSTHVDEMTLDHIENVTSNQSFFGKIFNYGDICIQGTNRNDINFVGICNPDKVRKQINELKQNIA